MNINNVFDVVNLTYDVGRILITVNLSKNGNADFYYSYGWTEWWGGDVGNGVSIDKRRSVDLMGIMVE